MTHQNKTDKITTRSASSSSLNSFMDEKISKRRRDEQSDHDIKSLDELWTKINTAIEESNERIESKIESCMSKINSIEIQLSAHKEECSTIVNNISVAVHDVRLELNATNEWVGRMEKSPELIITAIPFVTNENLKSIFGNIARTLGYESIPMVDLKRLARSTIKPGESPAIMCQFALQMERDAFYKKYLEQRNLNLSHIGFQNGNRIYINENLTQSARSIRSEALKLKRQGKLLKVYTKQGVVFVKTCNADPAVACCSLEQLEKLQKPSPI